jgi:hypothetical protein
MLATLLAVLVGTQWSELPKWLKLGFWGVLIIQGLYFSRLNAVDYRYLTDVDYDAFPQSTTTANENLPKGFTYLNIGDWQPAPSLLSGQGQINVEKWSGSDRAYQVVLTQDSTITEPTMKFLGWQTTVTDQSGSRKVEYYQDASVAGRIAYQLPAGEFQVRTTFTQNTPARLIGNTISAITLLGVVIGAFYSKRRVMKQSKYDSNSKKY